MVGMSPRDLKLTVGSRYLFVAASNLFNGKDVDTGCWALGCNGGDKPIPGLSPEVFSACRDMDAG